MTVYIRYLSDEPIYLLCSPKAVRFLGNEVLGMLTVPDRHCPDHQGWAVDDKHYFPEALR